MLCRQGESRQLLSTGLLGLAALLSTAKPIAAQTTEAKPEESVPGKQEILQELGVAQRMLADEEFIAGDRDKAKLAYQDAASTVGQLSTEGGFLTDADIRLQ